MTILRSKRRLVRYVRGRSPSVIVASVRVPRMGKLSIYGCLCRAEPRARIVVLATCSGFSCTGSTVGCDTYRCILGVTVVSRLPRTLKGTAKGLLGLGGRIRGRRIVMPRRGALLRRVRRCMGRGCGDGVSLRRVTSRLRIGEDCLDEFCGGGANMGLFSRVLGLHVRSTGRCLLGAGVGACRISRTIKFRSTKCFSGVFGGVAKISPGSFEGRRGSRGGG